MELSPNSMIFHLKSVSDTLFLGEKIGSLLERGDVLALRGTLGAGKTTLTKGIAKSLGVEDTITSPTFCLICEYAGTKLPLYHMDVYRLEGTEDFENLGAEELLYGDGVCIIEWSERIMNALPKSSILIDIKPEQDGTRTITIENWKHGELQI